MWAWSGCCPSESDCDPGVFHTHKRAGASTPTGGSSFITASKPNFAPSSRTRASLKARSRCRATTPASCYFFTIRKGTPRHSTRGLWKSHRQVRTTSGGTAAPRRNRGARNGYLSTIRPGPRRPRSRFPKLFKRIFRAACKWPLRISNSGVKGNASASSGAAPKRSKPPTPICKNINHHMGNASPCRVQFSNSPPHSADISCPSARVCSWEGFR